MPTLRELIPPKDHPAIRNKFEVDSLLSKANDDDHVDNNEIQQDLSGSILDRNNYCSLENSNAEKHGISKEQQINTQNEEITRKSDQCNNGITSNLRRKKTFKADWAAVIVRARSHPHEARESYFGLSSSAQVSTPAAVSSGTASRKATEEGESSSDLQYRNNSMSTLGSNNLNNAAGTASDDAGSAANTIANATAVATAANILTYKPLHAMLKYDPPLPAVEAVLRAHPAAVLDVTFEGSPLKIAAESKVSSVLVIRLLLVAEMAMRKKRRIIMQQQQCQFRSQANEQEKEMNVDGTKHEAEGETSQKSSAIIENACKSSGFNQIGCPQSTQVASYRSPQIEDNMFFGHNPIRWICEPRIPVKTAVMLLKWYPVGAFRRPHHDYSIHDDELADIDIDDMDGNIYESESPLIEIVDSFAQDHDRIGGDSDDDDDDDDDDDVDYYDFEIEEEGPADTQQRSETTIPRQSFSKREQARKQRRWEKFFHILYATDHELQTKRTPPPDKKDGATALRNPPSFCATTTSTNTTETKSSQSPSPTFRPVHAWIRCFTHPHLGLEHCRPYGVWTILRLMEQRIPAEFTTRDQSDGDRTPFQTLAESPANECRLCIEEVRDIVECLMNADYRSAFLPRKGDGRLIGHVALENGWPCRDLFSRKASAQCA